VTINDSLTVGEVIASRNPSERPRTIQGYYPTQNDFRSALIFQSKRHGYDTSDVLAEYKSLGLQKLLASGTYKRFPFGLQNNVLSKNRPEAKEICTITRAPLAYGFLVNPNRAAAFMFEWEEQLQKDVPSNHQSTPVGYYRSARSHKVEQSLLHTVELRAEDNKMRRVKKLGRSVDEYTVESKLARVFGADEWLVDLLGRYPVHRSETLPLAAYLADGGYSHDTLAAAVGVLGRYFKTATRDSVFKGGYNQTIGNAVAKATPRIDAVTSPEGYQIAVEAFGDLAGEHTLAWAILAERYRRTISQVRSDIAEGANPILISDYIEKNVLYDKAVEMSTGGVDSHLMDIMFGDEVA